jgi:hypothetical protein
LNTQVGVPDALFVLTDGFAIQAVAELNSIPLIAVAVRFCPKYLEGTMYSILMAALNLGSTQAAYLNSKLMKALELSKTNMTNLPLYIIIVNAVPFIPLILILFVDVQKAHNTAQEFDLMEAEKATPAVKAPTTEMTSSS